MPDATQSSSYQKARATADKLKKEREDKKASDDAVIAEVKKDVTPDEAETALSTGAEEAALAAFYKENAAVGMSNMGTGSLPILKIIESNTKVELPDGTRPALGLFYYAETEQTFGPIEVHLLTCSRGYWAPSLDQNKQDQPKYNQILAGVMADTNRPFVFYLSGKRLSPFWDWSRQELGKVTRQLKVPMFALTVELGTESVKNAPGQPDTHILTFKLIKDSEGKPEKVTDLEVLQMLKNAVGNAEEITNRIIMATEVNKDGSKKEHIQMAQEAVEPPHPALEQGPVDPSQDVNVDDIPF